MQLNGTVWVVPFHFSALCLKAWMLINMAWIHGSHPDGSSAFPCPAAEMEKAPWSLDPGHSTLTSPPLGKQPPLVSAARPMLSDTQQRPQTTATTSTWLWDPLLHQLIFLEQLIWDRDPRQVLQMVSSNGNRESKVPLRPWSQTGRLILSRGGPSGGTDRLVKYWGLGTTFNQIQK